MILNKMKNINTLVLARVGFGLMWLDNVLWKTPPLFGLNEKTNLYEWMSKAVEYPVFPPFSWVVGNVFLPNFLLFAWGVYVVEWLLAIGFIAGIKTRYIAILALGQSIAITLSVLNTPHEWKWAYFMMIMLCLVFLKSEKK